MTDQTTGPTAEEIAAKATSDAQARIKAIVSSDMGKALPTLANHLAFDTQISGADASKILEAAKADMPKAPAVSEEKDKDKGEDQAKSYEQHKAAAGALGLGTPDKTNNKPDASAGWGRAISEANASIGVK